VITNAGHWSNESHAIPKRYIAQTNEGTREAEARDAWEHLRPSNAHVLETSGQLHEHEASATSEKGLSLNNSHRKDSITMAKAKSTRVRVSQVPEGETKEQKFIRLATRRVNKVRKALDQIGLLGSASYASTDEQRDKVASAIRESMEFNLNRLAKTKTGKVDFKL
jgi:hypothetical protein